MEITNQTIANYYDYKVGSYNTKYKFGHITHAHSGLYLEDEYPMLFDNNYAINKLDIELLKYYLFLGQQNLLIDMTSKMQIAKQSSVLDCGSGHGGTSIFLAENIGCKVTGYTISSMQLKQSQNNVKKYSLDNLVKFKLCDCLDVNADKKLYDYIIGIESFCHFANRPSMPKSINKKLKINGSLVVYDYFINNSPELKSKIDNYWKTNLISISELITTMLSNGFEITSMQNLTQNEYPFWRISSAYSEILLKQGGKSGTDRARIVKSKKFHELLLRALASHKLQYYSIVFRKIGD